MKNLGFLILATVISSLASAQDYSPSKNSIYGGLGFTEGGLGIGVDYEYNGLRDFGVGGYVRIYQKDDKGTNQKEGITTLGGFIRPHFTKKSWDLYVSPGFGLIMIDSQYTGTNQPGDTTGLGTSLAIGLMYEISNSVALGVENMRTWMWFSEDWRGLRVDDMMLRFRMSF